MVGGDKPQSFHPLIFQSKLFMIKMHNLSAMCATCGCGIDLGSMEEVFARNYRCNDCGNVFRGFGYRLECPRCKSKNTGIAK